MQNYISVVFTGFSFETRKFETPNLSYGAAGSKKETPLFHYNVSVFFSAGIFRRESSWSLLIYSIWVYYVHTYIYI